MLGSLEGDTFDKAFMTLVTNQQSIMQLPNARIAAATDPEVKAFFTDLGHYQSRCYQTSVICSVVLSLLPPHHHGVFCR